LLFETRNLVRSRMSAASGIVSRANDGLAAWWYEHPEVPRERLVAISIDLVWRSLARIGGS